MPWKAFKRDNKWAVYKVDEDGNPMGDAVGMHDSSEKAMAQVKALYANTNESYAAVRTGDVHEIVTLREAELDNERHVARVRLIRAGWSKNDRYYPDHALQAASGLWEGVKAYADHPGRSEQKDRPERSVRDIVGVYENITHLDGATRADFRVIGAAREWLWPLVEESVRTGRDLIGLSINALGQTVKGEAEGRKGIVVEAITHANSVDVVTEPAAGGGFETLMMSDDGWTRAVLGSVSLEEVREARPDLFEHLFKEWQTARDSEALAEQRQRADRAEAQAAALVEEKRTLKAQLDEVRAELVRIQKTALVDSLLASVSLAAEWKADLRNELMETPQHNWGDIIDTELRKAKSIKPRTRVTGAGRPAGPPTARLRIAHPTSPLGEALNVKLDDSAPRPDESYRAWQKRTQQA